MKKVLALSFLLLAGLGLWNCNPDGSLTPDNAAARLSAAQTDSVGCVGRPDRLTKVDVAALPAGVAAYVAKTYAGATIKLAGKNAAGNLFVTIELNSQHKALEFKADGTFVQELEFRGGHDRGDGKGDGKGDRPASLTTIAASALPAASTAYITANYAGATIDFAGQNATGFVVGITVAGVRKVLAFNANGSFNQEMPTKSGRHGWGGDYTEVAVSALPATITNYITKTYSGSTIKRAAKGNTSGDYVVSVETADKKHIGLIFNADGSFKQVLTKK
jgi:hypothetical protein